MLENIFKKPVNPTQEKTQTEVKELNLDTKSNLIINEVKNDLLSIKNSLEEKKNKLEILKQNLEQEFKNSKVGQELDQKGEIDEWLKKEENSAEEDKKDMYNQAKLRNQSIVNEINSENPEAKAHLDKLIEINKMLVEIDNIERSFFKF